MTDLPSVPTLFCAVEHAGTLEVSSGGRSVATFLDDRRLPTTGVVRLAPLSPDRRGARSCPCDASPSGASDEDALPAEGELFARVPGPEPARPLDKVPVVHEEELARRGRGGSGAKGLRRLAHRAARASPSRPPPTRVSRRRVARKTRYGRRKSRPDRVRSVYRRAIRTPSAPTRRAMRPTARASRA